jgi:hypothetical protein
MGTYLPSSAGFTRLACALTVSSHMRRIGKHWARELRATAPRGPTGDYAANITVHTLTVGRRPRAAVQITANAPYSAILEVGSKHIQDPPRPMTKLLDRIQAADPNRRKG